jgi:hypothetical protein
MLPPVPPKVDGKKMRIYYLNQAARAQRSVPAQNMQRFMTDIDNLLQIDPSIADGIKLPEFVQQLAIAREIPQSLTRTDDEIKQKQQDRQQQQMVSQYAQQAQDVSGAMKNVGSAIKSAPNQFSL